MKAYIHKDDKGSLWLVIDKEETLESEFTSFTEKGVAYPVLEDKIAEIMRACYEYLEEKKEDADVFKD